MIDEILDWLSDVQDFVEDKTSWLTDLLEGLGGDSGFSVGGTVFGLLSAGIIFVLRTRVVVPFTQHMSPLSAIFWEVATYAACLGVGYKIGQKMFDD